MKRSEVPEGFVRVARVPGSCYRYIKLSDKGFTTAEEAVKDAGFWPDPEYLCAYSISVDREDGVLYEGQCKMHPVELDYPVKSQDSVWISRKGEDQGGCCRGTKYTREDHPVYTALCTCGHQRSVHGGYGKCIVRECGCIKFKAPE